MRLRTGKKQEKGLSADENDRNRILIDDFPASAGSKRRKIMRPIPNVVKRAYPYK